MPHDDTTYSEPAHMDEPASPAESEGFKIPPPGELYVYAVALFCGISMMMPVNAVFSAPSYITNYYQYAMKNPDAKSDHPNFWSNCMTYYILISLSTSLVLEPATLTQTFRRIPMLPRLLSGLLVLMGEIILIMIIPAVGTTESGAIITICFCGLIGGIGKSLFESTVYGMFGAFPPTFTATMMGGVGISGALTSLIQIIVRGALGQGYDNEEKQSRIYYGLDVGIQGVTFTMLLLLRFNSFARNHFGDLGGTKSRVDAGDLKIGAHTPDAGEEQFSGELQNGSGPDGLPGDQPPRDTVVTSDSNDPDTGLDNVPTSSADHFSPGTATATKPHAAAGVATSFAEGLGGEGSPVARPGEADLDAAPTSNEVLMATDILGTLRKIKWMFATCGFSLFMTLMLFPTLITSADPDDYWFPTIAVFVFNATDVVGRFAPTFKFTWPRTYRQRYIIVAASFARIIFLPLLLLYSYHYIPSHAFGYVMMVIFGFSNGYITTMALILGPKSHGINNDGQRFVAGTLMGISILIGGTLGTALSATMQGARGV